MAYAQHIQDPSFIALIDHLNMHNEQFKTWWETPQVELGDMRRELCHPIVGQLLLMLIELSVIRSSDYTIVMYLPMDEETTHKLQQLWEQT